MTQTIQIRCKNNKKTIDVSIGSSLSEIFSQAGVQMPYPPIVAKVNNRTKGLDFRLYCNSDVEYLDMSEPASQRAYTRTLFFVLCKAVHDLYPEGSVIINTAVSNGYYCEPEDQPRSAKERLRCTAHPYADHRSSGPAHHLPPRSYRRSDQNV